MRQIFAYLAGLVFGGGLIASGLANPAKVLAFLDIAGAWDPSLAVTMGAALIVTGIGYRIVLARKAPVYGTFDLPKATAIDRRLLTGAALFGIGWGLAGFCPGPAIVATVVGGMPALIFFAAMLAGMMLARLATRARPAQPARAAAPTRT